MAYLDMQLSPQGMRIVADSVPIETPTTVTQTDVPTVNAESANNQAARLLNDEKYNLINALSQFPATALWLLNTYEQVGDSAETDDESATGSELAAALSDIRRQFYALSNKANSDLGYEQDKKSLSLALQVFPYSFHDLTKLSDLVVYVYKVRGLFNPSATPSQPDWVVRRLEGLSRRNHLAASQWLSKVSGYDEQFLFLSSFDMHKSFTAVVHSEHQWLLLRQKLASANSRLVLFIANQYKGSFLDFDDLVQEGQTGLLKAVDRFDYRLGFQFSTYAGYWIRQAISRALSRCERVVRVPCGQVATINKVFRTRDQFITKTGKEPTINELAESAKLSRDDIHSVLTISQTALSLEGSEDDEESAFAPIDYLEQQVFTHAFVNIARKDLEELIAKAIKILNPREAQVICCHFGVDTGTEMTLQEIGKELNLTRERVRQIQVMALDKIRRNFGEQLLSFL